MECGIAFYDGGELELLKELKNFSRVEIPGELLDDIRLTDAVADAERQRFQIRELLSRKVISDLPEFPFRVCRNFLDLLENRCLLMKKYGMDTATLTPDLGRAAADKSYAAALKDIMLCIRGILFRYNINLLLELRLPENFESALSATSEFLHGNTLFTRLLIDFHLHEPKSFEILPQAVEMFPFKCDSWRISFEVASCNYLSADAVKKVAAVSRKGSWENEYMIFAPGAGAGEENYRQLDALCRECFKKDVGKNE